MRAASCHGGDSLVTIRTARQPSLTCSGGRERETSVEVWWRAVLKYPATWFAFLAVIVVEWLFVTLLDPPPVFTLIALILGAVVIVIWPLTMSVTGTLSRLQFEVVKPEPIDPAELQALTAELEQLEDPRPLQQLHAVQQKYDNLLAILEQRLDPGELTFARYVGSTQQVHQAALDNLHEVAVAMRSISAIDIPYIDARLRVLGEAGTEAARREREAMSDRRQLAIAQQEKISNLLAQNDSGMTAIDRASTALADAPIGRKPENADAAMVALEELAERASKYASD